MVAGKEGEELSWKLEGMAEVKVGIPTLLSPFSHLFSLPRKASQFPSKLPSPFLPCPLPLVQNWH